MKGKAIFVDDELLLLKTAERFFNKHNIECSTFAQWRSEVANDLGSQDILFLDLKMPGIDGLDVINELAARGFKANLVLLTGEDETILETAKKIAKKQGLKVIGSQAKPFKFSVLLNYFSDIPAPASVATRNKSNKKALSKAQCEEALNKKYLYPAFQPQINVLDHSLDGVECLARLSIPELGQISPAEFIPLFERYELIDQLTFSLLKRSLQELVTRLPDNNKTKISFNLSAKSINKAFTDTLIKIVNNSGIMPERITFEITETAAIELSIECQIALSKLRLKGFGLALDDFGTGFSTIKQLNELPFNEIKIDRSFVAELETKNTSQAIVSSTAKLAQSLGYRLVVEGVETRQQLEYLLKQHSHVIQGYLYSKPLSIEELVHYAKSSRSQTAQWMAMDERSMALLQDIKPVLLKPNTDKHYDFEKVLVDSLGFKVATFQDARNHIQDAKALILFNTTEQQLQEIKALNPDVSLYFLMADDIKTEDLLASIEQGYSDVMPTHIYPDAMCNKILTAFVAQQNIVPNTTTPLAKDSDALGPSCEKVLQLTLKLSEAQSEEALAQTIFTFLNEQGLETALCFHWQSENKIFRSSANRSIPLLERLFVSLATIGSTAQFSNRFIYNAEYCSLLILNLPDEETRKRQILAEIEALMTVLNMRAEAILNKQHWLVLNDDISDLESEFQALVNHEKSLKSTQQSKLKSVIEESTKVMAVSEPEQILLLHNIQQTLAQHNLEPELTQLLLTVRDIALQSKVPSSSGKKRVINN